MPRDKMATYERIIRCVKEEFLTFGYEKASLNRVSAKVGITTAGLYKHFKNKEDMFFSLAVLCEKVIGLDHLVEISGSDMLGPSEVWTQIGMKAGMPREGTTRSGNQRRDYMEETYYLTKESVLNYFKDHDLVLCLDRYRLCD